MSPSNINNVRISRTDDLVPPCQVRCELPVSDSTQEVVLQARSEIEAIMKGEDERLLVICGPCSVHDPEAGLEYARKLVKLRKKYRKEMALVMRVYFEKPRTCIGWKGLINDPYLNGTFDIDKGIRIARKLLCDIGDSGMPAATEFLDPVTPQYTAELISWGCIGARTVESQIHREMASGLSCPMGFKNTTEGSVKEAVDAVVAASQPHTFLSVTDEGMTAVLTSSGNQFCHPVLRGGKEPNYSRSHLEHAAALLRQAGRSERVLVDISHANSNKDHERQPHVLNDLCEQIQAGQPHLMGLMMESFLVAGRQDIQDCPLVFGQSVTDGCMGWEQTEDALAQLAAACRNKKASSGGRKQRNAGAAGRPPKEPVPQAASAADG